MEVPHDFELIAVDEFDALSIEPKAASLPAQQTKVKPGSSPTSTPDKGASEKPASATARPVVNDTDVTINGTLNRAWLHKNLGKFPAKLHARKVAKELGVKSGIIYLLGQEEKLYEDSDMSFEFRQRRYFYYLSGADFPGCAVTYDIEIDYLVLWIPIPEPRTVLWYGRTPTPDQCKAASEVNDVRDIKTLSRKLGAVARPGITIYALHPDQVPTLDRPKATVHIDTTKLKPAIDNARVIKTDYEIALIRRANAISSDAHKQILTHLHRSRTEHDILTRFTTASLRHGALHQAYPVIAAAGTAGSTLHYTANNQPLAGKQLVVLDAGAEWRCYASDVTRTFPISGTFSPEAAAIHALVTRMQDECIALARPGIPFTLLHAHACEVAVQGLLTLGVLRGGSAAEIFVRGTVAAFFPHGLGHHVGLEVHDVSGQERLLMAATGGGGGGVGRRGKREWMGPEQVAAVCQRERAERMGVGSGLSGVAAAMQGGGRQRLEKNMIVTVEPGIYFCREYIEGYFLRDPIHSKYINKEVLSKYWDVGGVRIEDDILITEAGYENLTWAPKGKEMLDVINRGSRS